MILSLTIPPIDRKKMLISILACGYTVVSLLGLGHYFKALSANCMLGVWAMFIHWRANGPAASSKRFGMGSMLFTALYLLVPGKTLLYAAVACAVLFMYESFFGRVGFIQVITLICMSPIFEYFTNVFSFPIRLRLTWLASGIMNIFGEGIHAHGNMLSTSGSEFSVDSVCVGLNMLSASLLSGIILIAIFQQRHLKKMSPSRIMLVLIVIVFLNLVCNLFRIVCLVHFRIGPDSALHSLVGICCLAVYVLIPSTLLIKWWILRSKRNDESPTSIFKPRIPGVLSHFLLLGCIFFAAISKKGLTANGTRDTPSISLTGYRSTNLADHITKLENGRALIYIKPIAGFYSSDHQPTICWAGSGYQFTSVEEKQIGKMTVYCGILQKDNEKLYTAWWYDDGSRATVSQLEWRWHAFSGAEKYALVNVTCASFDSLSEEINTLSALHIMKRSL